MGRWELFWFGRLKYLHKNKERKVLYIIKATVMVANLLAKSKQETADAEI